VFSGGAELDALAAIGGEDAVMLANRLADRSLVSWQPVAGTRRLVMLESIREVAALLLEERDEHQRARATHAQFHAELCSRGPVLFRGPGVATQLSRFERDLDNLRAVIEWSLEQGPEGAERVLQMLADAHEFWFYRGHKVETGTWLETAFSRVTGPPARVHLRGAICAGRAFNLRDPERSRYYADLASSYSIAPVNPSDAAWLMSLRSSHLRLAGRLHEAYDELLRALATYRSVEDDWGVVDVLVELAPIRSMLGGRSESVESLREAVSLALSTGDQLSLSFAISALGVAIINSGDFVEGAQLAQESERISRLVDNRNVLPWALYMQAECALAGEDFATSKHLLQQVAVLFDERGDTENAAIAVISAAGAALRAGDTDESRTLFSQGIPLVRASGSAEYLCSALAEVSHFASATANPYEAVLVFSATDAQCRAIDMHFPPHDQARIDAALCSLRDRIDAARFNQAWAAGSAWSMDEALDHAMSMVEEGPDVVDVSVA